MKLTERVEQLEAHLIDTNQQIAQLRAEIRRMVVSHTEPKSNDKKTADVEFGQKVKDMLHEQRHHPMVKNRDLYTTCDMARLIKTFIDDAEDYIGHFDSVGHGPAVNIGYRKMCTRLVNSGLFVRRKTQRYMPADASIGLKATRRRFTCIITNNFDKYEGLTENKLDNELCRQDEIARTSYVNALQAQKAKTANIDSEVSFL